MRPLVVSSSARSKAKPTTHGKLMVNFTCAKYTFQDMLQTKLVKLQAPQSPRGATDRGDDIEYPKAQRVPPTLFSAAPTPPTSPDWFEDCKFSSQNYTTKSSFTETANTESKFFFVVDQMSFRQLFRVYARFGDSKRDGEAMTLTCSDKWLRQANVVDNRRVSTTDTGIYFKQISKKRKALSINEYEDFLVLLSKKKNLNPSEMKYKMVTCGPPRTYKTMDVDNRNSVLEVSDKWWNSRSDKIRCRRNRLKRDHGDFFSNNQCPHGYNSQLSYSRFRFPESEVNLKFSPSGNNSISDWPSED